MLKIIIFEERMAISGMAVNKIWQKCLLPFLRVLGIIACIAFNVCGNIPKNMYIVPFFNYGPEEFFAVCPPFKALREVLQKEGFQVQVTDLSQELTQAHSIIVFDAPRIIENLKKYPEAKKILILLEPPAVMPQYYQASYHAYFDIVLTLFDNMVDGLKYRKLFFPQNSLKYAGSDILFEKKKLCTLIASNKQSRHERELYTERKKIIKFFESQAPQDFDFYGHLWPAPEYKLYRGVIASKEEVLKKYKFCICYENMRHTQGYITEKIFDCFCTGCVPVYWGAENITQFIPETCYIAREKFATDLELYNYLKSITQEQHEEYQKAIRSFLQSSQAHLFSIEYFVNTILAAFIDI